MASVRHRFRYYEDATTTTTTFASRFVFLHKKLTVFTPSFVFPILGLLLQAACLQQAGLLLCRYPPFSGLCHRVVWLSQVPVQPLAPTPRSQTPPEQHRQTVYSDAVSSPCPMTPRTYRVQWNISGLNDAALTLAAYASPLRLLYTGKARFRVRGHASPDGFRVSPPPQGYFRKISVRLSSLPSSTGFCLARHGLFLSGCIHLDSHTF